jgi:hypothetical protein
MYHDVVVPGSSLFWGGCLRWEFLVLVFFLFFLDGFVWEFHSFPPRIIGPSRRSPHNKIPIQKRHTVPRSNQREDPCTIKLKCINVISKNTHNNPLLQQQKRAEWRTFFVFYSWIRLTVELSVKRVLILFVLVWDRLSLNPRLEEWRTDQMIMHTELGSTRMTTHIPLYNESFGALRPRLKITISK